MKADIPAQYKRGFVNFLGCKIDLSKKTFIPRVETEFLVKKALKEIGDNQPLLILDVFSGSGCIGIAILKNVKKSFVDLVDIDEREIKQIKINIKLNKISAERYKVIKSDLFKRLKGRKYDYIFANPPYVARNRIKEVQPSVLKYEPNRALFGGEKGLFYIKKLLKSGRDFLKNNGIIYLEIDPLQKNDIEDILNSLGYKKFKFYKDQFKKYRWIKIKVEK